MKIVNKSLLQLCVIVGKTHDIYQRALHVRRLSSVINVHYLLYIGSATFLPMVGRQEKLSADKNCCSDSQKCSPLTADPANR